MAHKLHTTPAVVLQSAPTREADRIFWLLTQDLGLVVASAQSVREETSKMRYALTDLSHVRVTLVQGRTVWRITGAESVSSGLLSNKQQEVYGRIVALVRRVVPTDEVCTDVFRLLCNTHSALKNHADMQSIEVLCVGRLLYATGYLSCIDAYKGIIDTETFSEEIFEEVRALHTQLSQDINGGLAESQL